MSETKTESQMLIALEWEEASQEDISRAVRVAQTYL